MLEFSGGGIGVLATVLGISAPANALNFNTFTDRASWEAAVGGSFSEEDFNSFTVDTSFDNGSSVDVGDFTLNGFGDCCSNDNKVDASPFSFGGVDGTSYVVGQVNNTGSTFFNMTFNSAITAFGAEFDRISDDRITQLVADSEAPINIPDITSGFFGIVADGSFSTLAFQPGDSQFDRFGMDNVVYASSSASVPFEFSPTLGLFAVGGVWGVSRLRKKIAVSTITE